MARAILGLDIGGANLKAAHSDGTARSVAYALWRDPGGLGEALAALTATMPGHERLAVTMTGELCDCFPDKATGVGVILDAVESLGRGDAARIWTTKGGFVSVEEARWESLAVASANWLGLATWAGRFAPSGGALLIDLGTTTTDILRLEEGKPCPRGFTDPERLRSGELVYRGWKRTPLCALAPDDHAAELFATMHDVVLVLGLRGEDAEDCSTADGGPATREGAERRLARMCCADREMLTAAAREELARGYLERMEASVARALRGGGGRPERILTSGSGEFLLPGILARAGLAEVPRRSLVEAMGPAVSEAACAWAIAELLGEKEG